MPGMTAPADSLVVGFKGPDAKTNVLAINRQSEGNSEDLKDGREPPF
jgi:hypothetical protein